MKLRKKIVSLFMVSAVLMSFLAADISALYEKTVGEAESIIGGILDFELEKNGCADAQEWINGSITANAGQSSEWYAIILSKSGDYDLSGYRDALKKYIAENKINSATSRMKNALALLAAGEPPETLGDTAESSVGEQGIMSMIYGLHLLNNGCECSRYTAGTLAAELLSMQFADGGWAVMGENGDIDVTAMAVQALAPHNDDPAAAKAIDSALAFLSERQLDNGGYKSFGTENPESAAQVLIAMAQLGIAADDERFVKNGNTIIDGITRFRQSDGSFSHTLDGDTNETATTQVWLAMTAYTAARSDGEKLYIFERREPAERSEPEVSVTAAPEPVPETSAVSPAPAVADTAREVSESGSGYKPVAYIVIGAAALTGCVILFVLKKRRASNFIAVLIVAGAAAAFVFFTEFRSTEEYYSGTDDSSSGTAGTVTLSIRCDTIVGRYDSPYVPADGIILDTTEFGISEGETVYDILTRAARKYNIQLQAGANGYISGIGYLYEFDCGDLSGWIYHVNGDTPFMMCSEYKLSDGDRVEWLYTCDLGNDL
ncbi:MAG: DUF4430 domain-containing protein [Ruminiclostridium sp.]|nr:DUF4430 domain-containing protein [Ruminiclostridium sp.]